MVLKDLIILSVFLSDSHRISDRSYSHFFPESDIERTFGGKPTFLWYFFQCTNSCIQQFLGIFHSVCINQFLHVTVKIPVYHIRQIGLVCLNHHTQFLQGQFRVKKNLFYLQEVKKGLVNIQIHLSCLNSACNKLFPPLFFSSIKKQVLLPLRNKRGFFTFQK